MPFAIGNHWNILFNNTWMLKFNAGITGNSHKAAQLKSWKIEIISCPWSQYSMMQPVNSQLNKSFQLDGELDIVLMSTLSIPKNVNNPP